MSENTNEREAFEDAIRKVFTATDNFNYLFRKNSLGRYENYSMNQHWRLWQQAKSIAHKKNESVAEALNKAAKICDEVSARYQSAIRIANPRTSENLQNRREGGSDGSAVCAKEIRALIKDGE